MKKFVYSVWYGQVPYNQKIFTKYSDASKFIKEQISVLLTLDENIKEHFYGVQDNQDDSRV